MLRDAWEGMVIRDIATAGGVDPRQVSSSYWEHAKKPLNRSGAPALLGRWPSDTFAIVVGYSPVCAAPGIRCWR